ncbi:MAG: outer membrane protein assembly factor BamC [Lautropia sp.]|nr:outer membrane protein assembly factor BamC [Lautropia sp.]
MTTVRRPLGAAWPVLLIPFLLAGGCTSLRSALEPDGVEYRNARQGPMLDVPPDLVTPKADGRYALPRRADEGESLSEYNRRRETLQGQDQPRAGGVLPESSGARIHRHGQVRWIEVDAEPDAVWPVLLDFWAVQGFNLEMASPQLGIMETDWAERYQRVENSGLRGIMASKAGAIYATGERDKYRTRIERAPGGGTEIYLTYYGREEVLTGANKDSSKWVANNDNRPVLEVEYLRRMLARLGQPVARQADARQGVQTTPAAADAADGVSAPAAERARVIEIADQPPQLQIADAFERAWREVGLILDRLDFVIEDRHRDQGTYNIRYVDPQRRDEQQGALSRIFSGERKDLSGQHYQLHIAGEGEQSVLTVRLADGSPVQTQADRRVANTIVRVMQENLR